MNDHKISFKDWVYSTYGMNKDLGYYDRPQMFAPQVDWLKNNEGIIEVDKLIKFENLDEGINEVFKTLGINQKLQHVNKTSKTNFRDFYDKDTRKIIADWFHENIATFDYSFED